MVSLKTVGYGLLVVLALGYFSAYTVRETERVLVLRLGSLEKGADGKPIAHGPGLHFFVPIVSTALRFDKRLQTLGIEQSRVVTVNKKDVIVDSYLKWRIQDFTKYYPSATSWTTGQSPTIKINKCADR